jgi:hypothetical protein
MKFTDVKYLPAVLCALLLFAWISSQFFSVQVAIPCGNGDVTLALHDGVLHYVYCRPPARWGSFHAEWLDDSTPRTYVSQLAYVRSGPPNHWLRSAYFRRALHVPVPLAITALLPFAVGPFIRYRYPLWSWFAIVVMLCGKLAFYVR